MALQEVLKRDPEHADALCALFQWQTLAKKESGKDVVQEMRKVCAHMSAETPICIQMFAEISLVCTKTMPPTAAQSALSEHSKLGRAST